MLQIHIYMSRMWRNWNPHTLLVRLLNGAAAMENSLAVPQKGKHSPDRCGSVGHCAAKRKVEGSIPDQGTHMPGLRLQSAVRVCMRSS